MYGCCTHAGKTRIDVIPHKEYESQECYVHPGAPAEISLLIRVVCTSAGSSSRDIITNKSGLYTYRKLQLQQRYYYLLILMRVVCTPAGSSSRDIITNKSGLYTCRELQLQQR
jgi:hypothetical protein